MPFESPSIGCFAGGLCGAAIGHWNSTSREQAGLQIAEPTSQRMNRRTSGPANQPVISDHYFSSGLEQGEGPWHVLFKHLTLFFIRFHSHRDRCSRDGYYIFCLLFEGHCPEPPEWATDNSTHNTAVVLRSGRTWESSARPLSGVWPNFPRLPRFFEATTPASTSVTKIPTKRTSKLRAPCPGWLLLPHLFKPTRPR